MNQLIRFMLLVSTLFVIRFLTISIPCWLGHAPYEIENRVTYEAWNLVGFIGGIGITAVWTWWREIKALKRFNAIMEESRFKHADWNKALADFDKVQADLQAYSNLLPEEQKASPHTRATLEAALEEAANELDKKWRLTCMDQDEFCKTMEGK